MEYTITLDIKPSRADRDVIEHGINAHNEQFVPPAAFTPLGVFVRAEDDTVIGGLTGGTFWGWLYIEYLWLDKTIRRQGLGSALLEMAEQEAVRRGCYHVVLDTTTFQAPGFYEKHGFTVFGVLDDFPVGQSRIWMKKQLTSFST